MCGIILKNQEAGKLRLVSVVCGNPTPTEGRILIPAYNLFDAGAFLFTQKTFGKLTLAGGLRFDNRSMNSKELYLNEDEEPVQSTDPDAELKFSAFNKTTMAFPVA